MKVTSLRIKIWSAIILGLSAIWILITASITPPLSVSNIRAPREGFAAPDFTLTTIQGETISLEQFRGQIVLINFWASWCPPCRTEMPALQSIAENYAAHQVKILAVNATYQDDLTEIQEFLKNLSATFPVPLDDDGDVSRSYLVSALPTTFFIDREGIIRKVVYGGPISEALLISQIDLMLGEK